ncbi:MAG: MCP four helix bundle domain-containing protein, partial [Lachnospiraceae bacterium]|nr:MCP four helix bundle domain-containing protein [Lachnospiraceae bacterium]
MTKVKFGKSIRTQLLISFFFIVLLLILVGIASIYHVRRVYTNGKDIYVTNLKTVDYLKTLNINVRRIDKCIVDILEKFDDISEEDNKKEIEKIQEQNTKLMFNYENLDYSEEEKDNYDQCRLDMVTFNKYVVTLLDMVDKGELDEAKKLYQDKIIDIEADACNMLDKVADIATKNAEDSNEEN